MKFRVFIFAFILILTSSLAFAQNKDEESLKSLVNRLTTAQINYTPDVLDKIFTADYIEISPLGEFDPREKVLGFYSPEAKAKDGNLQGTTEAVEFSIRNYDKFAIVITRLNYSVSVEGKPLPPRSIRATFVCRKEKGAWKIASAQYTGIRPTQPQPAKPQ